jgi:hypothetical protein
MPFKTRSPFWGDEFNFIVSGTKQGARTVDVVVSLVETDSVRNKTVGRATFPVAIVATDSSDARKANKLVMTSRKSGSGSMQVPLEMIVETSLIQFPSEYSPVVPGHVLYKIVVRMLLEHDQKELGNSLEVLDAVRSNPAMTAELMIPLHSPLSRGIARDCSLRYGIQRIAPLINLGVVARALEVDASRIMVQCAHRQLDAVRVRSKELTKTESKYLRDIVVSLQASVKPWIVRYFIVLPENKPAGVLELLIELCERVAVLEGNPRPAAILETYARESAALTIQLGLTSCAEASGSVLLCEQMTGLAELMADSIARDKEFFAKSFSRWINLVQIECEEFSKYLTEAVPRTLELSDSDPMKAMTLYMRLRELTKVFDANINGFVKMPLCPLFQPHLVMWLASCEGKFIEWS